MKIIWDFTTDQEFIAARRMLYQRAIRNPRWTFGVAFVSILGLASLIVVVMIPLYDQMVSRRLTAVPPAIAYFMGLGQGLVVGAFVLIGIQVLVHHAETLRTWRLLLAFHDRLQQAGLLPAEDAAIIEDDPPPPRN